MASLQARAAPRRCTVTRPGAAAQPARTHAPSAFTFITDRISHRLYVPDYSLAGDVVSVATQSYLVRFHFQLPSSEDPVMKSLGGGVLFNELKTIY